MANEQDRNPENAREFDVSKAQSAQQPPQQASQQPSEKGQAGQFETDQAKPGGPTDEASQGDTTTQQRTDIEGSSLGKEERGEAESGFVGSEGQEDTSSELVDKQDNQEANEGK